VDAVLVARDCEVTRDRERAASRILVSRVSFLERASVREESSWYSWKNSLLFQLRNGVKASFQRTFLSSSTCSASRIS